MERPAKRTAAAARRRSGASQEREAASGLRELRRGQIIAAARTLVSERGLTALTFAGLEEELGVSRGVLTYHFADKDEILAALLQSAVDEIDAATSAGIAQGGSIEHALREVLRTKVLGFLGHPEATEILIAFWARSPDGAMRDRSRALFGHYRDQSAKLVRAARRLDPACAAEPQALAAVLVGLVIGLVIQARFDPSGVQVEAALEEGVQTLLRRLLPSSADFSPH